MAIDPELFIHESDRAALKTLKSIPGFAQVLKAFMKIWNEKQYRILNMSTFLNVNDDQMSEYYEMLKPICKKLGIKVPELYISLDPRPNAYTSGDTDPFIVVTSGLINAFPKELLPVVLAHECGHIVCHHVLYKTMGKMILNGAAEMIGFRSLLTAPIQTAFYYWMRCSEYSADRVAAVCCGDDAVTEMCMRLAGYDKNIPFEANKEAFMQQAVEYRKLIKSSAFNKTMEFMMFNRMTHPMNAVRAYECRKWSKTDTFRYSVEYVNEEVSDAAAHSRVPVTASARDYVYRDRREVAAEFHQAGFQNIVLERKTGTKKSFKEGQVIGVSIGGNSDFAAGTWFSADDRAVIFYYQPPTYEEISAEHPDELVVPASNISYFGRNYKEVVTELKAAGFTEFELTRQPDLKMGILSSEGDIAKMTIDGTEKFDKGDVFPIGAKVTISYHAFETPRR